MNNGTDLTIVLPTFNRIKFLRKTVESILSQSEKPSHVLIGNNASDDGTTEYLQTIRDTNIKVVNRKTNVGPWPNFDDLLNRVTTKYVTFLGDDDWLGVNFVKNRIEKINEFPKCFLIYGGYTKVNQNGDKFSIVELGEKNLDISQFAKGCLTHQIFWQSCLFKTKEIRQLWNNLPKRNIFDYCLMLEISARENLVTRSVGNSSDLFVRFHEGSDSNKTLLNTFKITDEYLKFHSNRNLNSEDISLERFHWNLMAARKIRENNLGSGFLHSLEALKIKPFNRSSWASLGKYYYSWFKK
jgi:glycosyltransferase involved in cell wall biosynthesis